MSIFDPLTSRLRQARRRAGEQRHAKRHAKHHAKRHVTATSGVEPMHGSMSDWVHGTRRSSFHLNPVVHRCVRMIAEACASIPLLLREDNIVCHEHDVMRRLAQPNSWQSGTEMRDVLVTHLLLHGNAYIERVGDDTLDALYLLRPERVQLLTDKRGWPQFYDYQVNGKKIRYDALRDPSPIIHFKLNDPADDHHGVSPLKAAALAIDIHNAANGWNKSLFDNAARPSGALVYRGKDGQRLTDAQFDRLKQELQDNFQGARNAGRPLLLEGGLDWASISMSPQDMDFIAAKHSAARDIALAFGVPPMLLGIPGDNSYANYAEANRAFWRHTIVPLNGRITSMLGRHLCRHGRLSLQQSLDDVPALADERRAFWQRIDKAGFLTLDEKREAIGLPPIANRGDAS